jgi:type III pantothenate kinase
MDAFIQCPTPLTWWIAQTGNFSWQKLKAEILKVRPHDKFKIITRQHIPIKVDVEFPDKVGIDRLLAAFAAVKHHGDSPMLIVDAGTAITVDVVQNQTFYGGAILPGLVAQSKVYPKISEKLPCISIPEYVWSEDGLVPNKTVVYPGKNTEDAIRSGLYWGTIGAIRQFYEMSFSQEKDVPLILAGGDAQYLQPGLAQFIPSQRIEYWSDTLVLEGIHRCFEEYVVNSQ